MRTITLLIAMLLTFTAISHAAPETRGLRVVAKDPATGQSDEVTQGQWKKIMGSNQLPTLVQNHFNHNSIKTASSLSS
jgi:hypothetical protein